MPLRTNGGALRSRRLLRGLTIEEFARQTGYSAQYVSQIELGHQNAGPRFLRQAAVLLDCTIEDITDGEIPRRRRVSAKATARTDRGAA